MMLCYLDGNFLPLEEARVSPLDRGFLFGDGAYEVIPVYSRRPFRLAEHLARLENTLRALRLPNPHPAGAWEEIVARIVAGNPWDDQSVYLQVTRGADRMRRHAFPAHIRPTVFLMSEALATPDQEQLEHGVAAVSAVDYRWLRCDLKTISLLANCLLRQQAVDAGCAEAVLFRDGFLTEGAASNIFAVRDGVLLAPPKSHLALPGITYDIILELAARHALPHAVREIREEEARGADELWMTSSTKEVLPITTLDGQPVGSGRPGECARRMHGWYREFKDTVMRHG
ncbi:MAG: D-amino acid aminotransferase [Azoarcus sp.]|jgi:D-alanine transaminase|nr:D-amino acid aminotransferase [Azoarcus sp.]